MSTPPGPSSSSADKPLKCEQYEMSFETSEELAEHNRKEHRM
jgi:hypothetical protein